MKKKINKFLSRSIDVLLTAYMMLSVTTMSYATGDPGMPTGVESILLEVVQILLTIAGLVCVGQLIIIGIKFLMASAEEKSNAKSALLPWLIGTIVCFGASWIGGAVINVLKIDKPVLEYGN